MASETEKLEIEQLQKVHGEATMLVALLSRYRRTSENVILRFFSLMRREWRTETHPRYCYLMSCESHSYNKRLIEFLTFNVDYFSLRFLQFLFYSNFPYSFFPYFRIF